MNVNKRFQRLQQWSKEKMGGESKTAISDDFKALEAEMNLRHEGLERMHSSMGTYVKALNKRSEGDSKEKTTAIAFLATSMTRHGEAFEDGNRFGECLIGFGQANERIARFQDTYASNATGSWLEALERSLAQMKDYQNARKKLESRRLAYDTSLAKAQKLKKEDYRTEEELRTQKAKFEESTDDVYRRMQDIIESEQDNSQDLYAFLEAELNYHDRCREVLLQAKRAWPGSTDQLQPIPRPQRSRTSTLSRVSTNEDDSELAPPALPFRARTASGNATPMTSSPLREAPGFDFSLRPTPLSRTNTNDTLSNIRQRNPITTAPSLRPTMTRMRSASGEVYSEHVIAHEDEQFSSSPDRTWSGTPRSSSPATSVSQGAISRNTSYSTLDSGIAVGGSGAGKKKPPPPPPSRGTKPAPPPPPMKRSISAYGAGAGSG